MAAAGQRLDGLEATCAVRDVLLACSNKPNRLPLPTHAHLYTLAKPKGIDRNSCLTANHLIWTHTHLLVPLIITSPELPFIINRNILVFLLPISVLMGTSLRSLTRSSHCSPCANKVCRDDPRTLVLLSLLRGQVPQRAHHFRRYAYTPLPPAGATPIISDSFMCCPNWPLPTFLRGDYRRSMYCYVHACMHARMNMGAEDSLRNRLCGVTPTQLAR